MPVPPVGIHSIFPCTNNCGILVRPKRMPKETAEALVAEHHGPDAEVLINTGRGICSRCRKFPSQQAQAKAAPKDKERDARLAAERLALAERARLALLEQRAARSQKRMVRAVHMGQSMVRI